MKTLFLVDTLNRGGVASAVKNFYTVIKKFYVDATIDFIVYRQPTKEVEVFFETKKTRIFVTPSVSEVGFFRYKKNIRNILKEKGPYDAIYLNTAHFIWIAAKEAKRVGIRNRVGSAHGSKPAKRNPIYLFMITLGRFLNRIYCTSLFACSTKSGIYNFGKEVELLPNIVDYAQIIEKEQYQYYQEFNISKENKVIGYLGVFEYDKNAGFIVDIMKAFESKEKINCIMAGNGSKWNEVKQKIENLECGDKIQLIGYRTDSYKLLKFFDVLVAPSFSEGMSLTLLEAQLTGTPCIVSEKIPKTNDLQLGLYYTVGDFNPLNWKRTIEKAMCSDCKTHLQDRLEILKKLGYDEKSVADKLYGALTKC